MEQRQVLACLAGEVHFHARGNPVFTKRYEHFLILALQEDLVKGRD
jgi:hypothetical protein